MPNICIRAGKNVYEVIRAGGFDFDNVTTYVGGAPGPRWLVASGFDIPLLKSGVLGNKLPVVLAGASSAAMRFAAWMQPEPEKSYKDLLDAYIDMNFTRRDKPETVRKSILDLIDHYIDDDALPFALNNKKYRLAVITARSRNLAASNIRWLLGLGLGACFICNLMNQDTAGWFFQRVVFHNIPVQPYFCLNPNFKGHAITLNEFNFKYALLASAALPMASSGVKDIYGAPGGMYRDGGLTDYHLNQRYSARKGAITLLFNHQQRIIPAWLDKHISSHRPPLECLEDVLMVYPSGNFIQQLPYGKLPDRRDFKSYADNPSKRMRDWRRAVSVSPCLGEEFLEIVDSGRLAEVTERL